MIDSLGCRRRSLHVLHLLGRIVLCRSMLILVTSFCLVVQPTLASTEGLKLPNLGESSTSLFSAEYEHQWPVHLLFQQPSRHVHFPDKQRAGLSEW